MSTVIHYVHGKMIKTMTLIGNVEVVQLHLQVQVQVETIPLVQVSKIDMMNIKNQQDSIGKGVLYKTFDVKVQVQNVPEL